MEDRTAPSIRSDLYNDYVRHKRWREKKLEDGVDRYSGTFRKIALRPNSSLLEIGFGEGRFLDWAVQNGHRVEGVEILPEMVDRSRRRGHLVHLGEISQLQGSHRRFDLIAAFDVLEHLTEIEILDLLDSADALLNEGGRILFQFPNGGSPFSALYQNGDATHRTALSAEFLAQMAQPHGWNIAQVFNARVNAVSPLRSIRWWFVHRTRDLIEMILNFAYYGARYPLDPNIIVVLERSTAVAMLPESDCGPDHHIDNRVETSF